MKDLLHLAVLPTLKWMGGAYDDPRAAAVLLAIADTESACCNRRQIRGSARSFLQIEPFIGLYVLNTRPNARRFWGRLHLPLPTMTSVRAALEFSDAGACMIGRELLWFRVKGPLPDLDPDNAEEGARQYLSAWRPHESAAEAAVFRFHRAWPNAVALVIGATRSNGTLVDRTANLEPAA